MSEENPRGYYRPGFGYRHFMHRRRFLTREERIALLERYRDQLEKELTGVKERIEELKKEQQTTA
jgi:hypothetical protein